MPASELPGQAFCTRLSLVTAKGAIMMAITGTHELVTWLYQ